MKSPQKMGFRSWVVLVALFQAFWLPACADKVEYTQRRAVAETFMNSIAVGDVAKAYAVSRQSAENKMAVKLMAEAVALKKQNESISNFQYVYLSEAVEGDNTAKVVFSQITDGVTGKDNLVVVLNYDAKTGGWFVQDLLLR